LTGAQRVARHRVTTYALAARVAQLEDLVLSLVERQARHDAGSEQIAAASILLGTSTERRTPDDRSN
jgi:hypothetical protein